DIDVHFTGARPGEKLFEELFFTGAHVTPTLHPKILRARDAEASEHNPKDIELLIQAARESDSSGKIRRLILRLVPEYVGVLDTGEFGILGAKLPDSVSMNDISCKAPELDSLPESMRALREHQDGRVPFEDEKCQRASSEIALSG
ncbi:MAG: polysaccharide biosynthesis protein, partial [bacterium]